MFCIRGQLTKKYVRTSSEVRTPEVVRVNLVDKKEPVEIQKNISKHIIGFIGSNDSLMERGVETHFAHS